IGPDINNLGPAGVAIGDLNNDSIMDVVVTNGLANSITVLIGNGDGSFRAPVRYPVGLSPEPVIIADVNNDQVPDIITANFNSNDVSVLLGQGDGTFMDAIHFTTGPNSNPRAMAMADIDNDNQLDLVVANFGSNNVSILFGMGNGTFRAPVPYTA